MLTGGGDVDPNLYGDEQIHVRGRRIRTGRLRDRAVARRGREGTPSGHLPRHAGAQRRNGRHADPGHSQPGEGRLDHSIREPRHHIAHEVWLAKGSRLATLLADHMEDGETCHVNSRHHQSVKQAAAGFDVTATSPDGVIEAMEKPDAPYCIAVQWHPENFWRTGEFRELFEGLVQAANAIKR